MYLHSVYQHVSELEKKGKTKCTCRCIFEAIECSNSRAHGGGQSVQLHLQMKTWTPREVESRSHTGSQICFVLLHGLESGILAKFEVISNPVPCPSWNIGSGNSGEKPWVRDSCGFYSEPYL